MSKSIKRASKEIKDGITISIKDSDHQMKQYSNHIGENLEYAIRYFLISISILISTNIYIHKTVYFLLF
jgi:hypothetical protein